MISPVFRPRPPGLASFLLLIEAIGTEIVRPRVTSMKDLGARPLQITLEYISREMTLGSIVFVTEHVQIENRYILRIAIFIYILHIILLHKQLSML